MFGFYYYVPPCPKCMSRRTGRYIRSGMDTDFTIYNSLMHGEIVKPAEEIPEENCFCMDCGYEWKSIIEARFFGRKGISKEKKARKTQELVDDFVRINGKPKSLWI